MTTTTVTDHEAQRFLHLPTRQLITVLLLFSERQRISTDFIQRTVNPLRREVRRRETLGFDDPFDTPYPEVTW